MSQSSVSRCIRQVSTVINYILMGRRIKFPTSPAEIMRAKQKFMNAHNFPGVVGVTDCTHVAIDAPAANNQLMPLNLYVNIKGYHSMNVQILTPLTKIFYSYASITRYQVNYELSCVLYICSTDLEILSVNAKSGGATYDSFVWRNSQVRQIMETIYIRDGLS
ncbi:hypothetical protein PR048_011933 [Dryococelus australis]|uniref:Nuclease HARBI1 n=1 Tax=Dryococelus australis TaxID=614101 RepID=A0ABQ9HN08_9NEOP|nr:hypothetical protein PR048_011933 [Dryococelus australis]